MPYIKNSSFSNPFYLFNGHLETIIPALARKVPLQYQRERLLLSDDDFVDLDWIRQGADQLVLLTHGLEGDSHRHYIKGMARRFTDEGWDALAWNCRSCSGEMNRQQRLYNHGEIGDIGEVVHHALEQYNYKSIVMIGFSMGGSITLKFLGTHGEQAPSQIKAAIAFSTPCDLKEGVRILDTPQNKIYKKRFLGMLRPKIEHKANAFPGLLDYNKYDEIQSWSDFDNWYTAPLNGFTNAESFYQFASAKNFMAGICRPTLLVNAQNDPLLTPACSPIELARQHPYIHLETPKTGGHVGFWRPGRRYVWSEKRAWAFVQTQLS